MLKYTKLSYSRRAITSIIILALLFALFPYNNTQAHTYGGHKWSLWRADYWLDIAWWPNWLIHNSFSTWNNACNSGCAGFEFRFAGYNARGQRWDDYNTVTISNRGATAWVARTYNRWWNSGYMRESDVVFNTYHPWGAYGESNMYDVRNVATHEFGHWLVLLDQHNPWDYWDTMYYSTYKGETRKRTLAWDDKRGIRAIY